MPLRLRFSQTTVMSLPTPGRMQLDSEAVNLNGNAGRMLSSSKPLNGNFILSAVGTRTRKPRKQTRRIER